MLIYAGVSPEEDGVPVENNYYLIIADLMPGIGHEIYFFFDDFDSFSEASFQLESGSYAGIDVIPHSRISFFPSEV